MAALILLKLIFWLLTSLTNLASLLLCHCIAILAILIIKLFKFPSQVIEAALQQAEDLIRAFVEFAGYAIFSIISNTFDLFVSLASEFVTSTASAAAELAERMRTMIGELAEILPELFEGVRETVGKVAEDIWSNHKYAAGYVFDKAIS